MAALPTFTDEVVRELFGSQLFGKAEADLNAGRLSERLAYRNGVLTAMWDHGRRSAAPAVQFFDGEVEFNCNCDTFDRRGQCVHTACIALAWAREPQSFVRLNQDLDLDMFGDPFGALEAIFGETVDVSDDAFDTGPDPLALGGPPGPAPDGEAPALPSAGPGGPLSASTLNTQWPDLTAAYAEELEVLTIAELRALAQRRGVKLSGNKREPILQTLAAALGNVPALREAWAALSPAARLVAGLAPFVETDYGASPMHVRQALQTINGKLLSQFDQALEELQQWGVMFYNRAHHLSGAASMLFFLPPDEGLLPPLASAEGLRVQAAPGPRAFGQLGLRVLLALKMEGARYLSRPFNVPHPLAAQAPELRGWPAVPEELEAAARAPSLFQALSQRPLTVPPAPPLLAEADHQRLAEAVGAAPEQVDFALRLLVKLGLAQCPPGEPASVHEEAFLRYLALPPLHHMPPLFNAFMSLTDWSELSLALHRTPGLKLKRQVRYGITYPALLSSLETARFFAMQLLRRAPAGQWVDVDTLVHRARQLNVLHGFWPLPPGVYLELGGRSLAQDNADNWRAYYRPYLEALLSGPLHWQGLVDLGYQRDKLAAVRLTELGALAFYQRESFTAAPEAEAGPALAFSADSTLQVAPGSASPQLLSTLALLGQAQASSDGRLCYAVTPAGAMRAFQAGWEPDRLLELLTTAAGQPAPAPLAEALRQWWAHFGDVQIYTDVALMELADDYALNELLASTSLAQHLLYRFGPRVIALRPEGVEVLRAELVGKGYTPKVAEGQDG